MFSSLLIANRGEIARRVIRTAKRLGIRTIAVYSEPDSTAPHVREADTAVAIGPGPARESYLNINRLLEAARASGARAVHPGYGFLSENAEFAQAVIDAGLVWVGPPPAAIRAMGLKDAAKRLMVAAGVPVTPGYDGADQAPEELERQAAVIGWPVLVKAVAGGGGKGMRTAPAPEDFQSALTAARREALAAFGDDRVLLEKLIPAPRHLEVQVFADQHGAVVHLFERDCSLQRRHQKVIEEAPAPGLDAETRAVICGWAVQAARSVDYRGAGTVEFIADGSDGLRADRIWFMEMNTRLQVEHPVTEAVTGLDLVEWQLRVAAGEPLPLTQAEIHLDGHAMEARLYAEDPTQGFLPSVGPLSHFRLPPDIRVDLGVEEGGAVSPFYDAMIAKLIVHEGTREDAARRLAVAARAVEVWPIRTNATFLARCADDADFIAGRLDTGFIEARLATLTHPEPVRPPPGAVAWLALRQAAPTDAPIASPWRHDGGTTGFRLNGSAVAAGRVYIDGAPVEASFDFAAPAGSPAPDGDGLLIFHSGAAARLSLTRPVDRAGAGAVTGGTILTPMPGRIVAVAVKAGDVVKAGQVLVVLEAMKMEHGLTAPTDGVVDAVLVSEGDQVAESVTVVRLAEAA
jgi:3-methylcrotonyl-CoA carboxylase alpha subunit